MQWSGGGGVTGEGDDVRRCGACTRCRATTISYAAGCSAGEARLGQDDGEFGQREWKKAARPEPRSAKATRYVQGFAGRNGGGRVTGRERMMRSLKCGFGNAELVSRGMTTKHRMQLLSSLLSSLPSYSIVNFFRARVIDPKEGGFKVRRPLEGQPFDLRGDSEIPRSLFSLCSSRNTKRIPWFWAAVGDIEPISWSICKSNSKP